MPTVTIESVTKITAISDTSGGEVTYISNQMVISPIFDLFLDDPEDSDEDLLTFTISTGIEPEYHNQPALRTDYFHVALCRRNRIYFIGGVG